MPDQAAVSTGTPHSEVELVAPDASEQRFLIAADHSTLLSALLAAGAPLPSSCRNGTCRACLAQVLAGQMQHLIEWPSLSAPERAQGYCLPCVARATSPHLRLRTHCLFET